MFYNIHITNNKVKKHGKMEKHKKFAIKIKLMDLSFPMK